MTNWKWCECKQFWPIWGDTLLFGKQKYYGRGSRCPAPRFESAVYRILVTNVTA